MSEPINDGGPAWPQHGWSKDQETLARMQDKQGMTLRDWFAGQALAGLTGNPECAWKDGEELSGCAFTWADAMIKAREAQP
jgi:hypothetical protein